MLQATTCKTMATCSLPLSPSQEMAVWLYDLERQRGKSVRVLHVGNIASNGYLNSKFLRDAGLDCYLLIRDYFHVMGLPEWEDAEIDGDYGSDYEPDFSRADLHGYVRPYWVTQGCFNHCIDEMERQAPVEHVDHVDCIDPLRGDPDYNDVPPLPALRMLVDEAARSIRAMDKIEQAMTHVLGLSNALPPLRTPVQQLPALSSLSADAVVERCIRDFDQAYPNRKDRLTYNDVIGYATGIGVWRRIFSSFDIVQCYATEPIFAMIAGNVPYVCFEHGTLRDFTRADDPLHRLTALAYWKASHTFVTNGDCVPIAAQKLSLPHYSPTLHPINVAQHEEDQSEDVQTLRASFNADIVLLCPLRHDWEIKGTDIHIRALPLIKNALRKRVKLICMAWGSQIEESRALVHELGCDDEIIWSGSLCRTKLIRYMKAADVVLDQIGLPCFGSTAPQAIAAGVPVIMSYVPESTSFIVDEPAPILSAFNSQQVAECVIKALDPQWRAEFLVRARVWTHEQHHPNRVILDHLRVYQEIVGLAYSRLRIIDPGHRLPSDFVAPPDLRGVLYLPPIDIPVHPDSVDHLVREGAATGKALRFTPTVPISSDLGLPPFPPLAYWFPALPDAPDDLDVEVMPDLAEQARRFVASQPLQDLTTTPSIQEQAFYFVDHYDKISEWPLQCSVIVTNTCNLKCVMCPYHSPEIRPTHTTSFFSERTWMDWAMMERIAEQCGAGKVPVKIGNIEEPLLHPRIVDFVALCRKQGVPTVHITSNGLPLTEDKARKLLEAGLTSLYISVDAADPDTYTRVRGSRLDKVERNVKNLLALRRDLRKSCLVMTSFVRNKRVSAEEERLFREKWLPFVDGCIFYNLAEYDHGSVVVSKINEKTKQFMVKAGGRWACLNPWQEIYVLPDGRTYYCCETVHQLAFSDLQSMGDFKEYSLKQIWQGASFRQLRTALLHNSLEDWSACQECSIWMAHVCGEETRDGIRVVSNMMTEIFYPQPI